RGPAALTRIIHVDNRARNARLLHLGEKQRVELSRKGGLACGARRGSLNRRTDCRGREHQADHQGEREDQTTEEMNLLCSHESTSFFHCRGESRPPTRPPFNWGWFHGSLLGSLREGGQGRPQTAPLRSVTTVDDPEPNTCRCFGKAGCCNC